MALVKADLAEGLRKVFEDAPLPDSAAAAGAGWAGAYRAYASAAAAGVTLPLAPSLLAAANTLGGALGDAFDAAKGAGLGGVAVVAAAIDKAFVNFWFGPPVVFASPPGPVIAGLVSLAPPGALLAPLSAIFAAGGAPAVTAAEQADAIAGALDAWTKTVMVINTPVTPPGPANPAVPLA